MKDEAKWGEKQDDEEEPSGRQMTVSSKKTRAKKKDQLRQTAHSDQSPPPQKIRLTCKQLALNYNKELILRLRAACDWLKYHSSIPGWRD